mmetsp:Transcript_5458/g.8977  ORF Transcript_5458/g.8977 Transcript_5458/m.8977 type:complete len:494 (-) Transcript_5458:66-1547(-)|eukprot:CAMPEP_0119004932 /NCGR_PEP_ID=MMETSP1176-20130426/1436_1 /TAXON_ID=265551 /ORGANISM="Synedropsis recta cf, Strain CCMP1620" /LENGTH=493 /DNA_ID=CAMNT_0006956693 /DNA_START=84 /DNA_END=1565 /DNA_ORIENTATION=-
MMMEKPRPKAAEEKPAKKKSAEEAVEELEKRLAALGGPSPEVVADNDLLNLSAPTVISDPAAASPPLEAPKEVKGGKNALLARIMAAQEKTKPVAPPPPASDVFGPPPTTMEDALPPPAYDTGLLPPPQMEAAPPAFDAVEDSVMAHLQQHQPPAYNAMAPPAASAPAFEDLLGVHAPPPPQQQFVPAPPPPEEDVIMGMEGLSPEERNALMEEQRNIMQQIESEKSANQSAIAAVQADNFDMRSTTNAVNAISGNSRAPTMRPPPGAETGSKVNLGGGQEVDLHGPERTKEAIKEGTAILVQCVNCENWMQVTGNATLMYCPVCAVVSPVMQENAAMSKEEALQMEADRKMAEQLQSEEYEERPAARQPRARQAAAPAQEEESWWDTVTGMFSTETKSEAPPPPMQSLPSSDERQSLTGGGTGSPARAPRQGARVAEQKPLFSCVVDSVNSTVGTLTGQLSQDAEGNVHGVDASSLLAVSNVGRDSDYQQQN